MSSFQNQFHRLTIALAALGVCLLSLLFFGATLLRYDQSPGPAPLWWSGGIAIASLLVGALSVWGFDKELLLKLYKQRWKQGQLARALVDNLNLISDEYATRTFAVLLQEMSPVYFKTEAQIATMNAKAENDGESVNPRKDIEHVFHNFLCDLQPETRRRLAAHVRSEITRLKQTLRDELGRDTSDLSDPTLLREIESWSSGLRFHRWVLSVTEDSGGT